MDNFKEEQRAVDVQANQETDTVESSLNKELDEFQSEIDEKFDILQQSISKLTNQLEPQEKENLDEEFLTDTILDEQAQLQLQEGLKEEPAEDPEELQDAPESYVVYGPWRREEEILPLLTEECNGKEAMEEHQDHNLPLPPIDSVYTLPTPAAHSNPKTPTTKATPSLLMLQNFKTLVANVQNFATTSKTMAAAHIACHSGWFECWFGFGAPEPRHF